MSHKQSIGMPKTTRNAGVRHLENQVEKQVKKTR